MDGGTAKVIKRSWLSVGRYVPADNESQTVYVVVTCSKFRCGRAERCRAVDLTVTRETVEAMPREFGSLDWQRAATRVMQEHSDLLQTAPLPLDWIEVNRIGDRSGPAAYCSLRCARLDIAEAEKESK